MADQNLTFEEVTEVRNLLELLDEFEDVALDGITLRDCHGEVLGRIESTPLPHESTRRRYTFRYPRPEDPARAGGS